jgi:hypothetical protein
VLVELEQFERLQHALNYDASEPSARDFYPLVDQAMKDDDALDPSLESYQQISADDKSS